MTVSKQDTDRRVGTVAIREPVSTVLRESAATPLVALDGGWFLMGSDDSYIYEEDGEGPVRRVRVEPFYLSACCVSNEQFVAFVDATDYVTDAERVGWSLVFSGLLPPNFRPTAAVAGAEWWRKVPGAYWRRPEGWHATIGGRQNHPVVHISWRDARAYCHWAGTRLPSEAEWEFAARGGLEGRHFPWGDTLRPNGEHRMNIWQGLFPVHNTLSDGYLATAPVTAYPPNRFGLFNMTGNVWEWTSDWYSRTAYRDGPYVSPAGPVHGRRKVLRGGSYLCHASYCYRYRVSARIGKEPGYGAGNVGFRCARSL